MVWISSSSSLTLFRSRSYHVASGLQATNHFSPAFGWDAKFNTVVYCHYRLGFGRVRVWQTDGRTENAVVCEKRRARDWNFRLGSDFRFPASRSSSRAVVANECTLLLPPPRTATASSFAFIRCWNARKISRHSFHGDVLFGYPDQTVSATDVHKISILSISVAQGGGVRVFFEHHQNGPSAQYWHCDCFPDVTRRCGPIDVWNLW